MNLQLPGKQQQAWFGEAGSVNIAEGLWMERGKTKLLWSTLGEFVEWPLMERKETELF